MQHRYGLVNCELRNGFWRPINKTAHEVRLEEYRGHLPFIALGKMQGAKLYPRFRAILDEVSRG